VYSPGSAPELADQESLLGCLRAYVKIRKRALTCGFALALICAESPLHVPPFAIRLQCGGVNRRAERYVRQPTRRRGAYPSTALR